MNSGRSLARFRLLLFTLLFAGLGCNPAGPSAHGGDPRVDVKGRKLVLPPPEGMVEALAAAHVQPPRSEDRDRVIGIYVPREEVGHVKDHDFRTRWFIVARIPEYESEADGANQLTFARLVDDRGVRMRQMADSTSEHLATQFELCRAGLEQPMPLAGVPPPKGWCLSTATPAPNTSELVVLLAGHHGGIDAFCDLLILSRGRILGLLLTGQVASVNDAVQLAALGEHWAAKVLAANP